jgi:hypothetical protein
MVCAKSVPGGSIRLAQTTVSAAAGGGKHG